MKSGMQTVALSLILSTFGSLATAADQPNSAVINQSSNQPVDQVDLSFLTPPQRSFVEHLMATPADQRRGSFCVAPGTSPEYIELLDRLMHADIDTTQRYELATRWPGSQGSPFQLTYSFVPDGVTVPADVGLPGGANQINALFDGLFPSTTAWQSIFHESFDAWSGVSGLSYGLVSDDGAPLFGSAGSGSRGDVRISSIPLDGLNGVLAYNQFPTAELGSSGGGDMVLDANDGANWANAANDYRIFRNTVMHEHGHGIGLMHVCPDNGTKLMEPVISTGFVGPQLDDVRSVQRHYGDIFEPNDSTGADADLGDFLNRTALYGDLSIDDNGDADVYKITTANNATLSATVTPVGFTYASGAQIIFGCLFSFPSNVNALTRHDLALTLIDEDGTTVLAMASGNPAGQSESINGFSLPGAGSYYLRVSTGSATDDVQIYDLDISVTLPPGDGDVDNDGDVDLVDFAGLQACQGALTVGCVELDFDADGAVDDNDVVGFVAALVGP